MATPKLLVNEPKVARTPQYIASGNTSINTNEFFFYSNNPEAITANAIADPTTGKGRFLNRVYGIKGYGQVYCWHQNKSNKTLHHCLLIHNPNNYPVKIEVPNCGLTFSKGEPPDTTAWERYCKGYSYPGITIPANGYGNLFMRTGIPNGYVIGIVARLNITKTDGSPIGTGVTLFDLAYENDSSGATEFANAESYQDTLRLRGLGAGFYTTISVPTITPTSANGIGFKIGSSDDTFKGMDCSYITAEGGLPSGRLPGAFGQQFNITIPVRNSYTTTKRFVVYIGSLGGAGCPFVYFNKDVSTFQTVDISQNQLLCHDMLEVYIPANSTENINFSTVIPAATSAPYVIGVRTA